MQVIRGTYNCRQQHQNGVLTIGNFDGLHLGHQKILQQLRQQAKTLNTHCSLMTLEPLPREYFAKGKPTAPRLMNRDEKTRALHCLEASIRPDYLIYLNFNQSLASMSADDFIEQILIARLNIKAIIIGDDFRFGCDRKGDYALLKQHGDRHGFTVQKMDSHLIDDIRVSSSLVRDALRNNQLAAADNMLGRAYTLCGHVNHGDKRGRTIGFPTANILLQRTQTPLSGVYSVTMHSQKYGDVAGIANLGRRPTVNGERVQLEVHLFDFERSLYGEYVCVSFQQKIRDEMKFESFDDLKNQIKTDCEQAKRLLKK